MEKTCNLSTVKNTPSGARRDTYTEYYYIEYKVRYDDIDEYHYSSVMEIICSIMEVLEYSDLSVLNNAVIFGHRSDGTNRPLYMFKNDVIEHSLRIIKFNR